MMEELHDIPLPEETEPESPWNVYGPYFRLETAASELGMSEGDIQGLIKDRSILGLETADGTVVIPAKQFFLDDEGNVDIPLELSTVLNAWDPEQLDGWSFLGVLASPQTWLDGQTIFEAAREGGEKVEGIVDEIEAWMKRLAR